MEYTAYRIDPSRQEITPIKINGSLDELQRIMGTSQIAQAEVPHIRDGWILYAANIQAGARPFRLFTDPPIPPRTFYGTALLVSKYPPNGSITNIMHPIEYCKPCVHWLY